MNYPTLFTDILKRKLENPHLLPWGFCNKLSVYFLTSLKFAHITSNKFEKSILTLKTLLKFSIHAGGGMKYFPNPRY